MASKTGAPHHDLANAFRQGNFKPLYFFYGDEGFVMDELQALLIEHALQPHERDFNLDVVFGPEAHTPAVLARCGTFPMMAERRVVVVRGFEQLEDNEPFKGYAEEPNPSAVVLLICNRKPNLAQNPYRALKKHAVWAEFKTLYDDKLPGWISRRLKAKGYAVQGGAAQMIAEAVGPELRTTSHEIDKLIAYVGEQKTITEDDVIHAAGHSREANVFELQKAIGQGAYERSLSITDALLSGASNRQGEALMVVSVLVSYFTKLWKLTSCLEKRMPEKDMPGHIGVSPFFLGEYIRALRTYRTAEIHRAFDALLAADVELKGGSERGARLILTLALGRLCARTPAFS
ncbi:MAG: DNA polymerase III subunit delta [Bacteroidetes bacterium]|nr:DNA polymerase III subunit delta [Bacteroidota bacterium]